MKETGETAFGLMWAHLGMSAVRPAVAWHTLPLTIRQAWAAVETGLRDPAGCGCGATPDTTLDGDVIGEAEAYLAEPDPGYAVANALWHRNLLINRLQDRLRRHGDPGDDGPFFFKARRDG